MQHPALRRLPVPALALALSLAAGCGSSDDSPAITGLALNPASVAHGMATVTVTFTATDADVDAGNVQLRLTGPGGASFTSPSMTVTGLAGHTNVPVGVMLTLTLPTAGSYTVEVWVTDAMGNASNHLTATLTVT